MRKKQATSGCDASTGPRSVQFLSITTFRDDGRHRLAVVTELGVFLRSSVGGVPRFGIVGRQRRWDRAVGGVARSIGFSPSFSMVLCALVKIAHQLGPLLREPELVVPEDRDGRSGIAPIGLGSLAGIVSRAHHLLHQRRYERTVLEYVHAVARVMPPSELPSLAFSRRKRYSVLRTRLCRRPQIVDAALIHPVDPQHRGVRTGRGTSPTARRPHGGPSLCRCGSPQSKRRVGFSGR